MSAPSDLGDGAEKGEESAREIQREVVVVCKDDGIEGVALLGVGIDDLLPCGIELFAPCFCARYIKLCDHTAL